MREVVIVDSVRTGLAKSFRGKFNMTRPDDMAAHCVNALIERTGIDPKMIDDCIVGADTARRAEHETRARSNKIMRRMPQFRKAEPPEPQRGRPKPASKTIIL